MKTYDNFPSKNFTPTAGRSPVQPTPYHCHTLSEYERLRLVVAADIVGVDVVGPFNSSDRLQYHPSLIVANNVLVTILGQVATKPADKDSIGQRRTS